MTPIRGLPIGVLRPVCQLLLVTALCLSVGLHWGILQSVAWAGMLVRETQTSTVREAIHATFDGHHPCGLCKFVAQGKQTEHGETSETEVKELDSTLPLLETAVVFVSTVTEREGFDAFAPPRHERPGVPPPKSGVL